MKEIFERVSIRKYEDKPVEPAKIEQILKAAMAAPSAGNQQPWEFYVVTDKEKIRQLSQISPGGRIENVHAQKHGNLPARQYKGCSGAALRVLKTE